MSRHARLAPSAAGRWMSCPGSINASEGYDNPANANSAEGSVAHDLAAAALEAHREGKSPAEAIQRQVGATFIHEGFDVTFTQEMADALMEYVDYCVERWGEDDDVLIEQSMHGIMQRTIDPDTGGTADFIRYDRKTKTLDVVDLKFGKGIAVDADDNKQLKLYAAGALFMMDQIGARVETINLVIVQPRHEGTKTIKEWSFTAAEILEFLAEVKKAAEASRQKDAPLHAGDWCKWCPARVDCKELERNRNAIIEADFKVPTDPAKFATALATIPQLQAWIKAVESEAYKLATGGTAIPGYKLVKKRANRKFNDEQKVIEFAEEKGVDPYASRTLLSPAQFEKKLDAAGKKELAELEVISTESSGTTLVPASDKRPAFQPCSDDDFDTPKVIEGEFVNVSDLF